MTSSPPPDRRARKRLATRQAISNAATRLFLERGFDAVTVDEIAAAADVGRMTVFNHFPRKEDMFFDRDEAGRELLREALHDRGSTPVEALRRLAHRLAAEESPYVHFSPTSLRYIAAIEASETLLARARTIGDELAALLADELGDALAAHMLVATWAVAFTEAHRLYREGGDAAAARAHFTATIDRGARGVEAAIC